MLADTVDILIDCFSLLVDQIFSRLVFAFDLYGLLIGFFVTTALYRFVFIPLFTGSTGVSKFVGSDHARKKVDP